MDVRKFIFVIIDKTGEILYQYPKSLNKNYFRSLISAISASSSLVLNYLSKANKMNMETEAGKFYVIKLGSLFAVVISSEKLPEDRVWDFLEEVTSKINDEIIRKSEGKDEPSLSDSALLDEILAGAYMRTISDENYIMATVQEIVDSGIGELPVHIKKIRKMFSDSLSREIGFRVGLKIRKKYFKSKKKASPKDIKKILSEFSVVSKVTENEIELSLNPESVDLRCEKPCCVFMEGFIEGLINNPEVVVKEIECKSSGGKVCKFKIESK